MLFHFSKLQFFFFLFYMKTIKNCFLTEYLHHLFSYSFCVKIRGNIVWCLFLTAKNKKKKKFIKNTQIECLMGVYALLILIKTCQIRANFCQHYFNYFASFHMNASKGGNVLIIFINCCLEIQKHSNFNIISFFFFQNSYILYLISFYINYTIIYYKKQFILANKKMTLVKLENLYQFASTNDILYK